MAQDEPQPQNQEPADQVPAIKPTRKKRQQTLIKNLSAELPTKPEGGGRTKPTPPEVQAAIIACLLSGQFPTDEMIAKEVNVSKATVSRLKGQIPPEILKQLETQKSDRIGILVEELLAESLESLKRIAKQTTNQIWMDQQNAAELATLYGVKADKIIKILEAIERANAQGASGTGDSPISAVSEG